MGKPRTQPSDKENSWGPVHGPRPMSAAGKPARDACSKHGHKRERERAGLSHAQENRPSGTTEATTASSYSRETPVCAPQRVVGRPRAHQSGDQRNARRRQTPAHGHATKGNRRRPRNPGHTKHTGMHPNYPAMGWYMAPGAGWAGAVPGTPVLVGLHQASGGRASDPLANTPATQLAMTIAHMVRRAPTNYVICSGTDPSCVCCTAIADAWGLAVCVALPPSVAYCPQCRL